MNKLKRPPVNFDDAAKPAAWVAVGDRLMRSAALLWVPLKAAIDGHVASRGNRSQEETRRLNELADHFSAFFLVAGSAVENYLKARLIARRIASEGPFRNGEEALGFVTRRKAHDLVALAAAANVLTPTNRQLLDRLSAHVLWAGRYPVPRRDPKGASSERTTRDRDFDDIQALVENLKR